MKKIIFIDGEPYRIEEYYEEIEELTKNIEFFKTLKQAEECISEQHEDIGLIIMELMFEDMEVNKYTGKDGGINFYKELKQQHPEIRVIILTKRRKEVLTEFITMVTQHNDKFLEKIYTLPLQLKETAINMISSQ